MTSLKTKIRKKATGIAKNHARLRGPIRKGMNTYRLVRYRTATRSVHVDSKVVFFSSFDGRGISDNPRALFEYMVRSKRFEGFTFVWGLRADELPSAERRFVELLGEVYPDVELESENGCEPARLPGPTLLAVRQNCDDFKRWMARAKYWVLNYKVPDYLEPSRDQVFLQTWHGTPLKRLGYDLEHFDNVLNTAEGMKKRYGKEVGKFTYFLSPNPFSSSCFRSAWRMEDFGKGDIILETGYPRNDILTNATAGQISDIRAELLVRCGLDPADPAVREKKIVLYAPTYRSDKHETGVGYTYREGLDFDRLRHALGDGFIILFRAHYLIAKLVDFEKQKGFVCDVSEGWDMCDLLLASDILVTDYSSSMFDFSILRRPMVFYMYDLEHYRDESNGFYFDPEEELPGPIVRTEEDLALELKRAGSSSVYEERYRRFNEKYNSWEDGHASERVVDAVFPRE